MAAANATNCENVRIAADHLHDASESLSEAMRLMQDFVGVATREEMLGLEVSQKAAERLAGRLHAL